MKITRKKLEKLIKEEIDKLILESQKGLRANFETPWARKGISRLTIARPSTGTATGPNAAPKGEITARIDEYSPKPGARVGESWVTTAIGKGMSPQDAVLKAIESYLKGEYARRPGFDAKALRSSISKVMQGNGLGKL